MFEFAVDDGVHIFCTMLILGEFWDGVWPAFIPGMSCGIY